MLTADIDIIELNNEFTEYYSQNGFERTSVSIWSVLSIPSPKTKLIVILGLAELQRVWIVLLTDLLLVCVYDPDEQIYLIIEEVIQLRDCTLTYEAMTPDGTPDMTWLLQVNDQAEFGARRYMFEADTAELSAMWKCCLSRQIDLAKQAKLEQAGFSSVRLLFLSELVSSSILILFCAFYSPVSYFSQPHCAPNQKPIWIACLQVSRRIRINTTSRAQSNQQKGKVVITFYGGLGTQCKKQCREKDTS